MPKEACQGQWRERYPLPETKSTDQLMQCTGCGQWMVIHADGTSSDLPAFGTVLFDQDADNN